MIIGSSNPIPGMTRTDGEAPSGHLLPRGPHAYGRQSQHKYDYAPGFYGRIDISNFPQPLDLLATGAAIAIPWYQSYVEQAKVTAEPSIL